MPYLRSAWAFIRLPVAALLLAAMTAGVTATVPASAQQPQTSIGVDADPAGNAATALGTIDDCVEISEGESHAVDIFIQDVTDLLAWGAVLTFEPTVVEIVGDDAALFMAASEGSDVQNISGELSAGRYQLGAFDAADPPAPNSGSGVLARVTVKGVGRGVTALRVPLSDLDGDGNPDEGPLLRDVDANIIGDTNSDTLFDGPNAEARIAVDASCDDPLGAVAEINNEEEEEDGLDILTVVVVLVGLVASIAVGGLAAWAVRRSPRTKGS
jgi:hypothetical protein